MKIETGVLNKSTKGGMIAVAVKSIGKVVKALLGGLSTKDLYWSLLKYLGEALSVALLKSVGEVVFGMGEVLKGKSEWYKKDEARSSHTTAASGAFSSTRSAFGGTSRAVVPSTRNYESREDAFPAFAS